MLVGVSFRPVFFTLSKKFFSFSRYLNFCISDFPTSPSLSVLLLRWLKINLKVYDVINCLNKNLIAHFVWAFVWEKHKDAENVHQKLIPDSFFVLLNNQNRHYMQEILLQIKYFERELSKCFKKDNFIFLSNCMLECHRSHSYVLVCHPCITRMSLACTRMSSVCHSNVLVCHPYVTRMWFYHEPFNLLFADSVNTNSVLLI